jgi:hypothetical protein
MTRYALRRQKLQGLTLAQAIGRDPRATDPASALRPSGFSVTFAVTAASAVEAHETASRVLRLAWTALNVEANAGEDYDISNVTAERM